MNGATAEVNDYVRGPGSYETAVQALRNMQDAGFKDAKISDVCTRQNIGQLDEFKALGDEYGATLRLTRLRPSGRGGDACTTDGPPQHSLPHSVDRYDAPWPLQ